MKRVRQIVVALVGLFYVGLLYPLCGELWHSKWLLEMHDNECEPMFITFLVGLGVFLLLAVRKPSKYRVVIAFAAFHALAHATTMLIQSIETSVHKVPRGYDDVILFGVIGIALLLSIPPEENKICPVTSLVGNEKSPWRLESRDLSGESCGGLPDPSAFAVTNLVRFRRPKCPTG